MMPWAGEIGHLTERLDGVSRALRTEQDSQKENNPQWDFREDARLTVFATTGHVVTDVSLGLDYERRHLVDKRWWKRRYPNTTPRDAHSHAAEFHMFLKMGLVHFLFCAVESSFRAYVRCLDADACKQGTAELKSVYEWLFGKLDCSQWIAFMDFWRLIRNAIHNLQSMDELIVAKLYSFRGPCNRLPCPMPSPWEEDVEATHSLISGVGVNPCARVSVSYM